MYQLGMLLWESGQRDVNEGQFLEALGLRRHDWDVSIVNLLAQEGIIFRNPNDDMPHTFVLTPVYDRLGGFIIADALLKRHQRDKAANWVKDQDCIERLFGSWGDDHQLLEEEFDRLFDGRRASHQLAQDIVHALVALFPQRTGLQFWMVVPTVYKEHTLKLSTLIDADDFCDETKAAYKQQLLSQKIDRQVKAVTSLW
jgi:hypothetical protein